MQQEVLSIMVLSTEVNMMNTRNTSISHDVWIHYSCPTILGLLLLVFQFIQLRLITYLKKYVCSTYCVHFLITAYDNLVSIYYPVYQCLLYRSIQ